MGFAKLFERSPDWKKDVERKLNGTDEIDDQTAIGTATSRVAKVGEAIREPGYEGKCNRARNEEVSSI